MNSEFTQFGERNSEFSLFGNNQGFLLNEDTDRESEEFETFDYKAPNSARSDNYEFENQRLNQYQASLIGVPKVNLDIDSFLNVAPRPAVSRESSQNSRDQFFSEFDSSLEDDMRLSLDSAAAMTSLRSDATVFQPRSMRMQQMQQQQPAKHHPQQQQMMPMRNMQQNHQQYREQSSMPMFQREAPSFGQHNQQQNLMRGEARGHPQNNFAPHQYQQKPVQQMAPRPYIQQQLTPHGQQQQMLRPPQQLHMQMQSYGLRRSNGKPAVNADSIVYQVQFKLEFRYFVVHPQSLRDGDVAVSDFVIVEGEKGEDLGVVVDFLSTQQYTERRNRERNMPQFAEDDPVLRYLLRVANSWVDCSLLPEKYHDEKIVVEHTSEVVNRILCLPMQIVAAEYQFDRTKLFIYYTSNTRVDFRELISKLYAIFKTCIWLKKLHPNQTFDARRDAVIALRTGSRQQMHEMY